MKICIDAGHNHSGWDTGASANNLKEQDVTYQIASHLQKLLENHGIKTVMTREKTTQNLGTSLNSSLKKRAQISNYERCNYFVSVHCNAGGGTGTEVLVIKKGAEAEKLGARILEAFTRNLSLRSRGIKEANLLVLRETDCPAVLVETAFLDHPSDAQLLRTKQKELALAIAHGIFSYLGISPTDELTEMKEKLSAKWALSDANTVFSLLDQHPYPKDLYEKLLKSYEKE